MQDEAPGDVKQGSMDESRNAFGEAVLYREIPAYWRRCHIALARSPNLFSLGDQVVSRSSSQTLNSQPRIGRTLRRQNASVTDEEIRDIVRAPELVDN
jgi:hypothetical protein